MKIKPASELYPEIGIHYGAHNSEVKQVWDSFNAGNPIRMPMVLGVNFRHIILNPALNPEGFTFCDVYENMELFLDIILRFTYYMSRRIPSDREMGTPEKGWNVGVSMMNTFEVEWLGGKREYINGDTPDIKPFLTDDNKNMLFDRGIPDVFSGSGAFARDAYEAFCEMKERGTVYEGAPISGIGTPFDSTDGPMTLACAIRGVESFCIDLYEDTDYALSLLDFITEATISRIKQWRRYRGLPEKRGDSGLSFADDSIALLSKADYERFILPFHKRLQEELFNPSIPGSIHLCGDATRHFVTLRDKLNMYGFDTGFPVRHGELARELGEKVTINGGPVVGLLLGGTPEQVYTETKRIIDEVRPYTRRFVMREANNLAPCTPDENIAAMYRAVKDTPY